MSAAERLARVVDAAGAPDVERARAELGSLAEELRRHEEALQSAAAYPVVLGVTVVGSASVVLGLGAPALMQLPGGGPDLGLVWVGVVVCVVILAVLVGYAWHGGSARVRLEGFALIESVRLLVGGGVALPTAIRASAGWCTDPSPGLALARSLEAGGGAIEGGELLSGFESTMLASAAGVGQSLPTLLALAESRRVALGREIPEAVGRVHVLGLCLAGLAVLLLGSTWMDAYLSALVAGRGASP